MIIINGTSLTVEQVAAVARTGEQVAISDEAKAAVNKARAYVEKKLDEKAVVYGLTTGFGKFSDKYIPLEDTAGLGSATSSFPIPAAWATPCRRKLSAPQCCCAATHFAAAIREFVFPQSKPCFQC